MKKEQIEIEANKIISELNVLEVHSKLGFSTIKFLSAEADKLVLESKNPNLSFEERDTLCNQMDALQQRLGKENELLQVNMKKLKDVSDRFEHLRGLKPE